MKTISDLESTAGERRANNARCLWWYFPDDALDRLQIEITASWTAYSCAHMGTRSASTMEWLAYCASEYQGEKGTQHSV